MSGYGPPVSVSKIPYVRIHKINIIMLNMHVTFHNITLKSEKVEERRKCCFKWKQRTRVLLLFSLAVMLASNINYSFLVSGDIACELSHHTQQVYLSTRSGSWVISRLVDGGAPLDITFMNRFLDLIPMKFRAQVFRNKLESNFNLVNFGLGVDEMPNKRFPIINDELPHRIFTGSIQVKADIAEVQGNAVHFADGSKVEDIDAIILAIGFKFSFPFLSDSLLRPKDRYIPLYKYVFPPTFNPGTLAIIGAIRVNGPLPPLCEIQSRWAASVFAGKAKLPDCQTMVEEIERRQHLLEANTIKCCRAFHLVRKFRNTL